MITKNKTITQLKRLFLSLLLPAAITTAIPSQAQTDTDKLPHQLRVASYNIQHGVGMDQKLDYKRIADVLETINPDVVAIQEVDSMTRRTGNTYSLGEIADHMRYYASYAPSISFDGGKYGIGILSRKRSIRTEQHALPGREEARTLLVAEFDDYVFAATHLSLTEADLMASISIIENVAKKYSKPFIIAGDFNALPDSPFIKQLEKNFYICNNKGKSWPADNPRECLDYIAVYKSYGDVRRPGPAEKGWEQYRPYVGEPAVMLHSEVVNTLASDHRPIFADIVLPTPVDKLLTTQPYLQLATPTSMNVMFQTNSVCHCWIEYGTDTYRPCTELWGPMLSRAPFDVALAGHTHDAKFYPKGVDGCRYPVYVGGGYSKSDATVAVLSCRGGKLSMRILSDNPDTRWTLNE